MKKTGKCPKCGGADIISDAKAIDRSHGGVELDMSVATFRRPDALIFKEKEMTTVSAWVCASCGFVEFYADDPRRIRI
jgi:predicted nucleic-acid-binding Zn-ribbon protein